DWAIPRLIAFDLGMHWTGVERRLGSFLRQGFGWRDRDNVFPAHEPCWIRLEFGLARTRTEVIGLTREPALSCGGVALHLHAADWVVNFQEITRNCATLGARSLC